MTHDQPDTAARVEKLGVGASLSARKFNARSLGEKLKALITSQAVLDRCQAFAQRIDPDQALHQTRAVIEAFADAS
jgi:UDP:flavonoid glycosyltransferase YjiC (YdhE family)